jgi:translation initiation factor eIF-2B subunit epsilon
MAPITTERPKVLLPLVNAPMIEYILEWLATSGVVVVHILACSHADLLKQYLTNSSKWADSELEIHIISSYNCLSAGEALRLVDQKQIIKDDFILVSGDVVTNMKLQTALTAHKHRRCGSSSSSSMYI